jgi:hypothetical protein
MNAGVGCTTGGDLAIGLHGNQTLADVRFSRGRRRWLRHYRLEFRLCLIVLVLPLMSVNVLEATIVGLLREGSSGRPPSFPSLPSAEWGNKRAREVLQPRLSV